MDDRLSVEQSVCMHPVRKPRPAATNQDFYATDLMSVSVDIRNREERILIVYHGDILVYRSPRYTGIQTDYILLQKNDGVIVRLGRLEPPGPSYANLNSGYFNRTDRRSLALYCWFHRSTAL